MEIKIKLGIIFVLTIGIAFILTILVDIFGTFIFGTDWNMINNYATFILLILAFSIIFWTWIRKAKPKFTETNR